MNATNTVQAAATNRCTTRLSAEPHGPGPFVALDEKGIVVTSADVGTWTRRRTGTPTALRFISRAEDTFAAVGDSGTAEHGRWT